MSTEWKILFIIIGKKRMRIEKEIFLKMVLKSLKCWAGTRK